MPERLVFATYFLQLAALALLGVAIGLAIGGAPSLAQSVIADVLPVRARSRSMPGLAVAAGPSACWCRCCSHWCRSCGPPRLGGHPDAGAVVAVAGRLPWRDGLPSSRWRLALAAFTIFTADSRRIAAWFVLGRSALRLSAAGAAA